MQKIKIYKFSLGKFNFKEKNKFNIKRNKIYFLYTNIGILVIQSKLPFSIKSLLNIKNYRFITLFVKTSPGRIIFDNNYKNIIK